jgi:putative transposase
VRYAFIQQERVNYPVRVLCRVMQVSVSGFYHWRGRLPSARSLEQTRVLTAIRVAHARGRGFYGPKKLRAELLDNGLDVGINRIRRLRRKHGIYCLHKKRFRTTTQSGHRYPVSPNFLEQQFATTRPAEAWVADITYVDTDEGWLYVAGVKDLFTKELVGWAIDTRLTASLAIAALDMATRRKQPGGGLLHHSDRGVQYACGDYQHRLRLYGMRPSMSRKGNCWDNAPMESFFATFKTELIYQQQFATRDDARAAIFEYIEVFYNRQRRHASIGNVSPAEFERRYHAARMVT